MKNVVKGGLIAILVAIFIIFLFESGRSLLQFALGFLLFILPITFISSFKSTLMSFLLILFSIVVLYIIFKFSFFDAIFGIILALIVGGYLYYSRVSKSRPFSATDYKNSAKDEKEVN